MTDQTEGDAVNGSDESPAVVELPDDLIEVAVAAAYEASFDEKNTWQMLIRTAVEAAGPLIAARVCAEAVADERQRIRGALERLITAETPGLFKGPWWPTRKAALAEVARRSVPTGQEAEHG